MSYYNARDIKYIGMGLGVFALFGAIVFFGSTEETPEEIAAKAQQDSARVARDQTFMAYIMCQDFVERQLKAPSTADWPPTREASIARVAGDTFRVVTYVDAQNSFGVMIRSTVQCDLVDLKNDQWRALDVQVR